MFMNVVVKRQIPGTGPTVIFEFPKEVYDLDKEEKELDWLFKLFRDKNYELEMRDWNFPRNPKMVFSKKLPSQPPNTNWKDVWIITLERFPLEERENITRHISSVLIK